MQTCLRLNYWIAQAWLEPFIQDFDTMLKINVAQLIAIGSIHFIAVDVRNAHQEYGGITAKQ